MPKDSFINKHLFAREDISPLIVFRICFGLLIFLESAGAIFTGWVEEVFILPKHHFTFIGFEWLEALIGEGMYYYYGFMALLGLMVLTGFFYRVAIALFTVMWWGCYLMQKVHYNNHYYFLILLCLFMLIVPANRYFSLDVKRNPSLKSYTAPAWCRFIFIVQVFIVFTYASIVKIYPDWLQGKPVDIWFASRASYPVIGPLFSQGWFKGFVVFGGIIFDLLVVPLLLWRKTRVFAFCLLIFFNLFNSIVFQIGIFPYLMVALAVFFFPPDKIRKLFFKKKSEIGLMDVPTVHSWKRNLLLYSLSIYFLFQLLLPLRHYLYEGNVLWSEEGHRMAWQMMLRTKRGTVAFEVKNPLKNTSSYFPLNEYYTRDQIVDLAKKPDMIWQAVQLIKKAYREKGMDQIQVFVYSSVSLNGGPHKPIVDPQIDMAKVEWKHFEHAEWILPYE